MSVDKEARQRAARAVTWALSHGMAFKVDAQSARHVPFTLSPTAISAAQFHQLVQSATWLSEVLLAVMRQPQWLSEVIAPVALGDAFFARLLALHQRIQAQTPRCLPVHIVRSDFMQDITHGAQLIECNGIAAGMAPFGQRAAELQRYLHPSMNVLANHALTRLASAWAKATLQIKDEFNETGPAHWLMVVQAAEDNVFDQQLLADAVMAVGQAQGREIITLRRTLGELSHELTLDARGRLQLTGVGALDGVYLRAGYQPADYQAADSTPETLYGVRLTLECARIALNATVAQQLAGSKRVQQVLSAMSEAQLQALGVTPAAARGAKAVLGEIYPISAELIARLPDLDLNQWVLKNQGEGGGHCLFGAEIAEKLQVLNAAEFGAWLLMRRCVPATRAANAVRGGQCVEVSDLMSEIGLFTVHLAGEPAFSAAKDSAKAASITLIADNAPALSAYAGYLVRSKSAASREGGVHSGQGVLDALQCV
ncbi:MAG: glutathione synthase [Aeromonas sp.]